jgi:peptidoglycan/LPS O-acetylase OafA/YrhL
VIILSIASFYLLERPARRWILSLAALQPRVTLQQEAAAPSHL